MNYEKPFAASCGDGCITIRGVSAQVATFNNATVLSTCDMINAAVAERERDAVESAADSAKIRVVFEDDAVRFNFKLKHGETIVCSDRVVSTERLESVLLREVLPISVYGIDELKRKVAVKALRDAIDALQDGWRVNEVIGAAAAVERLRARADAIKKGEA